MHSSLLVRIAPAGGANRTSGWSESPHPPHARDRPGHPLRAFSASRYTSQPKQRETQQPVTQQERNAAQRLRTTMAAVKLSFTWLGVRKTLAPEQRTTAA